MDVSGINEAFNKFRRFSLIGLRSESCKKLNELERTKCLRTLLLMPVGWKNDALLDDVLVELLPKLQFLRVLSVMELSPWSRIGQLVKITKVPESIGNLKHLRYLNFSYTGITCLPEQVSSLYNLQSLLVRSCDRLSSLPESFAKLKKLQHLDISNTPELKKMPLGIAGLTSLQTLTKVIIEKANGFKISDLKGLPNLQGHLFILGLEKVTNSTQATDASLLQKKDLDVLEMDWSDELDNSRNEMMEYEVLKELRPPPKLKTLKILNNKGTRFPSWFSDPSFDRLSELILCGCRSTHLPTLGSLRSLRELFVEKMSEVKTVGFELLAPTNCFQGIAFPSLEVLKFDDMQDWDKWSINIGIDHETFRSFPRLHEISIKRCPKLAEVSLGFIPSLRVLCIEKCSKAVLKSMVGLSSSLVKLEMRKVKGFTQLHGEDLMHLGELERLVIEDCDELRYLWEQDSEACKSLVSLQELQVWTCKKLVSSAEEEVGFGFSMKSLKHVRFIGCNTLESYSCLNNVGYLEIIACGSLKSLTFSTVQEHPSSVSKSMVSDCDGIQPMSRLISLTILNCKNLESFPHEHLHGLTALQEMQIDGCPSMDYSFPCGLWPPNLTSLKIGRLNKPMSEWGVQKFPTSLVELTLSGENSGVVSFSVADDVRNTPITTSSSSFLLPSSLVSLTLCNFTNVESFSEVLQHLPCLKTLYIVSCPKIRDIKTTWDPSNLTIAVL